MGSFSDKQNTSTISPLCANSPTDSTIEVFLYPDFIKLLINSFWLIFEPFSKEIRSFSKYFFSRVFVPIAWTDVHIIGGFFWKIPVNKP